MELRIQQLYEELIKIIEPDTVFACIGAIASTSILDSVGPQVGDRLKKAGIPFVYGTTAKPYNGITAESMNRQIIKRHPTSTVIALDTCCTSYDSRLYKIKIDKSSIAPGAGAGKCISRVGDYSIRAFILKTEDMKIILNEDLFMDPRCEEMINKVYEAIHIISTAIIRAYTEVIKLPLIDTLENKNNKGIYKLL